MSNTPSEYVQYGCGWSAPDDWRNFDASPTLRFERMPLVGRLRLKNDSRFPANVEYGDIVSGLPVAASACNGVYCSHVLEHLSLNDCRKALLNTRTILRKGGVFRLVLPDLEKSVTRYLNSTSEDAASDFMRETYLGLENRAKSFTGFLTDWLGNSRHLWMWDFNALRSELKKAGFSSIRRAQHGDSEDPMFRLVEDESRWTDCLGIECRN